MSSTREFAELVGRLRLDRYRDEDDLDPPWVTWWHLLLRREESVAQEGGPNLYSSDYDRNPHYEAGYLVLWTHWGLGVEAEGDLWTGDPHAPARDDTWHLSLVVGPVHVWLMRRSAKNRRHVFEK